MFLYVELSDIFNPRYPGALDVTSTTRSCFYRIVIFTVTMLFHIERND